jgi:dGTPase
MGLLIGGLIEGTVEAANGWGVETLEDVRALECRLAKLTPQAAETNGQMRGLLVEKVYSYVQLVADRSAAVKKMGELFTFLLEHPDRVTPGYRENLNAMPVHRVVCDYIAGMTDSYFTKTYESVFGR